MGQVLAAGITVLATTVLGFAWFNAIAARPDWAFVLVFAATLTMLARARISLRGVAFQTLSAAVAGCALTAFGAKEEWDRDYPTGQAVFVMSVTQTIFEWATAIGFGAVLGYAWWFERSFVRSNWKAFTKFCATHLPHAFWFFAGICLVFGVALTITDQLLPAIPLLVVAGLSCVVGMCCSRARALKVLLLFASIVALILLSIRLVQVAGMEGYDLEIEKMVEPFGHSDLYGNPQPPLHEAKALGLGFPGSHRVDTSPWFDLLSADVSRRLLTSYNWTGSQLNKIRAIIVCALIADCGYFVVTGSLLLYGGSRQEKEPPAPPLPIVAVTSGSSRQTPHFQASASLHPTPDDSPLASLPKVPAAPKQPASAAEFKPIPLPSPGTHPSAYWTPGSHADNILFSQDYRPVFIELRSPAVGHIDGMHSASQKEQADVLCRVPTLIGTMKREMLYGTPGSHTRLSSFVSPALPCNLDIDAFPTAEDFRVGGDHTPFAVLFPAQSSTPPEDIEERFISAVSPHQAPLMRPPPCPPAAPSRSPPAAPSRSPLLEFHYEVLHPTPSSQGADWRTPLEGGWAPRGTPGRRGGQTEPIPVRVPQMWQHGPRSPPRDRWISTYTPPQPIPKLRVAGAEGLGAGLSEGRPRMAERRHHTRGQGLPTWQSSASLPRWGSLDTFPTFRDESPRD